MKTHLLVLLILFAISSCKNTSESSLELNADPLTAAYKKNKVAAYLRVVSGNDTIYRIDSVSINKEGFVTLKQCKHGYSNKTIYQYDQLNRIIECEHHSDVHYKVKTEYQRSEKPNRLTAHNFAYSPSTKSYDKKPGSITYFKFGNGKLLEETVIDVESKDTIVKILYRYNSKGKIIEISRNMLINKEEKEIKYKYRSNNTLREIIENDEVKYISKKTGLIDSIEQKYPNEKTTYTYYFRS